MDFSKELSRPGLVFQSTMASLIVGGLTIFSKKIASWITLCFVFFIMLNDISNVFFCLPFESVFLTTCFCILVWFYKAFFDLTFLFVVALVFFWLANKIYSSSEKPTLSYYCLLAGITLVPPDVAIVAWIVLMHAPATLISTYEHTSLFYVVFCFACAFGICFVLPPGMPQLSTTIIFLVFRCCLYVQFN